MRLAKERGIATILVGHVTKEGSLAGPRVLEHLVDCVLSFEGERERTYRTLRALKNRFGSTNEVGVFEMRGEGLVGGGRRLRALRERGEPACRARCVLCAMEGSRPLLVEVQALVAPSELVPPRRVANGVDRNRLALVLAVLSRHGGPGWARATCSCRSPAACASTSRAPTSRSRWRSRPPPRGSTRAARGAARSASARSA